MLRAPCSVLPAFNMRIAFLYNEATEDPALVAEEEQPTLSPVVAALDRLGHSVSCVACTLDLSAVRRQLERIRPDVAFNRVESLGGSDAMMAAIPLLLETLQIPYTGCSSEALAATASKLAVKQRLVDAGLPTPPWIAADGRFHAGDRESQMRCALRWDLRNSYSNRCTNTHRFD